MNENGNPTTVNADRYKEAFDNAIVPYIQSRRDRRSIWYMHDGARAHTADDILDHIQGVFGERFISNRSSIIWPPQSPDLNPLDYFFWGCIVDDVYKNDPNDLNELMDVVYLACEMMDGTKIRSGTQNFNKRVQMCYNQHGLHFEQYL